MIFSLKINYLHLMLIFLIVSMGFILGFFALIEKYHNLFISYELVFAAITFFFC